MDTNLAYAMAKIMKIRNVGDYSRYVGHTDRHPLVSVIDYAEVSPVRHSLNNYSVYGIFFHDEAEIDSGIRMRQIRLQERNRHLRGSRPDRREGG